MDKFLSVSVLYTKFRSNKNKVARLKVLSNRINYICSGDLADVHQLAKENDRKKILLVFVDCFCSVKPSTTSQLNRQEGDLKKRHEYKNSKMVGLTKKKSSKGSLQNFAWKDITVYSTHIAQKLCFAHHYIRTLGPILFKYVQ